MPDAACCPNGHVILVQCSPSEGLSIFNILFSSAKSCLNLAAHVPPDFGTKHHRFPDYHVARERGRAPVQTFQIDSIPRASSNIDFLFNFQHLADKPTKPRYISTPRESREPTANQQTMHPPPPQAGTTSCRKESEPMERVISCLIAQAPSARR